MRAYLLAAAFVVGTTSVAGAATTPLPWRVTKTAWSEADEKGYGAFVRKLAESGCKTTIDCLRDPANPYRDTDPATLRFRADCAKWVYMLRAYYTSNNGLPFSYVNYISGTGADLRFTATSNSPVSRRDLVDDGTGIPLLESLRDIHDRVWTATFRMHPAEDQAIMPDFYSPKIAPGAIRAGTAIYDINGHVGIVYDVTEDGRILYMDAHPDESVSRSVYGPQFGQSPAKLGGGFKNFRPMKLVGATQQPDGSYIGGQIVLASNREIPDYSLEQYRGNVANADSDGPSAKFEFKGAALGLFGYARASMSNGGFAYNPVYELQTAMRSLCHDVRERELHVNMAVKAGIQTKAHPPRLPGNTALADNAEWEAHTTYAMDARLKNSVAQLYKDMAAAASLWQQHDARIVYDGPSLQETLQKIYAAESNACVVTYVNSEDKTVALGLHDMLARLFTMSFDPYHCIERRWGASGEEAASCKDDAIKTRWFGAEQRLRNLADAGHSTRPALSLSELEAGMVGSGADAAPATGLKLLIDAFDAKPAAKIEAAVPAASLAN
jgi:hypothetical protein